MQMPLNSVRILLLVDLVGVDLMGGVPYHDLTRRRLHGNQPGWSGYVVRRSEIDWG